MRRDAGESGHLYAGEIVEAYIIVHVVGDAKRHPSSTHLPWDVDEAIATAGLANDVEAVKQ
jgi:hypothetical protein